ncbi:hypothetical protein BGZ65_011441, partial [Modicella reniformis]
MDARTSSITDRLKSPVPLTSPHFQNESIDREPSTFTVLSSALKRSSKGEESQPSPTRSVEFQLPDEVKQVAETSAKAPKGRPVAATAAAAATAATTITRTKTSQRRNQRIKIEEVEPTIESTASNFSTQEPIVETPDQPPAPTTARKRLQEVSEDRLSASSPTPMASSSSRFKPSIVSVVITKKRKLTEAERDHNRRNWGNSFSGEETGTVVDDISNGATTNTFDHADIARQSSSSASSTTDIQWRSSRDMALDDDHEGGGARQRAERSVSGSSKSSRNRRQGTSTSSVIPTDDGNAMVVSASNGRRDTDHPIDIDNQG